jgi:hypothetical protein
MSKCTSGWLTKQGGFVKAWKLQWFVLNGLSIDCYTKENGVKKGSIDINQVK